MFILADYYAGALEFLSVCPHVPHVIKRAWDDVFSALNVRDASIPAYLQKLHSRNGITVMLSPEIAADLHRQLSDKAVYAQLESHCEDNALTLEQSVEWALVLRRDNVSDTGASTAVLKKYRVRLRDQICGAIALCEFCDPASTDDSLIACWPRGMEVMEILNLSRSTNKTPQRKIQGDCVSSPFLTNSLHNTTARLPDNTQPSLQHFPVKLSQTLHSSHSTVLFTDPPRTPQAAQHPLASASILKTPDILALSQSPLCASYCVSTSVRDIVGFQNTFMATHEQAGSSVVPVLAYKAADFSYIKYANVKNQDKNAPLPARFPISCYRMQHAYSYYASQYPLSSDLLHSSSSNEYLLSKGVLSEEVFAAVDREYQIVTTNIKDMLADLSDSSKEGGSNKATDSVSNDDISSPTNEPAQKHSYGPTPSDDDISSVSSCVLSVARSTTPPPELSEKDLVVEYCNNFSSLFPALVVPCLRDPCISNIPRAATAPNRTKCERANIAFHDLNSLLLHLRERQLEYEAKIDTISMQ